MVFARGGIELHLSKHVLRIKLGFRTFRAGNPLVRRKIEYIPIDQLAESLRARVSLSCSFRLRVFGLWKTQGRESLGT